MKEVTQRSSSLIIATYYRDFRSALGQGGVRHLYLSVRYKDEGIYSGQLDRIQAKVEINGLNIWYSELIGLVDLVTLFIHLHNRQTILNFTVCACLFVVALRLRLIIGFALHNTW